ncbi:MULTISPECIES: EamA family transporter RarD [Corallincola]|uniref:EamA family transporter RarD n=2 Tax=Corallincola TaxID=1775176 RepID=A0A368N4M9_9GAMM|nr:MULTISPECIES: EamA family transporter RarD [Corallincola]RCU45517.1 EamA family transporter RarD [Corallincola holothuriorum]TAA40969.1 EamA family transporter RarD [Corallincola spongiicola]
MTTSIARHGTLFALAAYLMWGVAPIYFKQLAGISAPEVLIHRVVWSFLLLLVVILLAGRWNKVQQLFRQPKYLALLTLSSVLIAGNWGLFIWAVSHDMMLEASLGYYINPLFNVVVGMLFLGERLRPLQWGAVALAAVGVLIPLLQLGTLPWVALTLASSFCLYGLIRKQIPVDALTGLLLETALLLPLALVYWANLDSASSDLSANTTYLNTLLISAGVVTTLPLLCFAAAAKRMPLSTLGFFQYIGPSCMFLLAIGLYGEVLQLERLITFGFIWAGLALFTYDSLRKKPDTLG